MPHSLVTRWTLAALTLALTLALALGGWGCGGARIDSPDRELVLEPTDYEVSLPASWKEPSPRQQERAEKFTAQQLDDALGEQSAQAPEISYRLIGFSKGNVNSSAAAEANLEPLIDGISLEQYSQASQSFAQNAQGEFKNLGPYEAPDLDGDETIAYRYDQTVGGFESSWLTVQAIHGDATGVTVHLSAPSGEFERHEEDFLSILTSWRWAE